MRRCIHLQACKLAFGSILCTMAILDVGDHSCSEMIQSCWISSYHMAMRALANFTRGGEEPRAINELVARSHTSKQG